MKYWLLSLAAILVLEGQASLPLSSPAAPEGWIATSAPDAKALDCEFNSGVRRPWQVHIDGNRVEAVPQVYMRRDPLPIPTTIVPTEMGELGERHVLRVSDGWLVGYDGGEWGGQLVWFNTEGTHWQRLIDGDIQAIVPLASGIVALDGIAHLTIDGGGVSVLERKVSGTWVARPGSDLGNAPLRWVPETPDSILVLTTHSLFRVKGDGSSTQLYKFAWRSLPSDTMALGAGGIVYLGASHFIAALVPSTGGYTVQWFARNDCAIVKKGWESCRCIAGPAGPFAGRFTVTDIGTSVDSSISLPLYLNARGDVAFTSRAAASQHSRSFAFVDKKLIELVDALGAPSIAGIDDQGVIAATIATPVGHRAVTFAHGRMRPLTQLESVADGVTPDGAIYGRLMTARGGQPFVYLNGSASGFVPPRGLFAKILARNSNGTMLLERSEADGTQQLAIYSEGKLIDTGVDRTKNQTPVFLNALNWVIYADGPSLADLHYYLNSAADFKKASSKDLSALMPAKAKGLMVSGFTDDGLIVGTADFYGKWAYGLRWTGKFEELLVLDKGGIYDVTPAGRVVGQLSSEEGLSGFEYPSTDFDLNDAMPGNSPWRIVSALRTNDEGDIVALGVQESGAQHLLLLRPRTP